MTLAAAWPITPASYLDVNCANCHRPGGTVAAFDARFDTPLEKQGLIDGPVLINEGIDHARMIAPNDRWRSILYMRANTVEAFKMPPLARQTVDQAGMTVLRQWIESLGGRPVLAPPDFSLAAGNFPKPIDVNTDSTRTWREIRYTLDGSIPGTTRPALPAAHPSSQLGDRPGQGFQGRLHPQHHRAGNLHRR